MVDVAEKIFRTEDEAVAWAAAQNVDIYNNIEHRGTVWVIPHPWLKLEPSPQSEPEPQPEPEPDPQPDPQPVVLHRSTRSR